MTMAPHPHLKTKQKNKAVSFFKFRKCKRRTTTHRHVAPLVMMVERSMRREERLMMAMGLVDVKMAAG
jgi:hypothetical protein